MDKELIKLIVELVLAIVVFLLGRYVFPKYKIDISAAAAQFNVILNYAESFVAYARQFLNCSGKEKMDDVVKKLKAICDQQGIQLEEETLRAIAQKAYDAMVANENKSKVILETQLLEEVKIAEAKDAETEESK